MTLRRFFPLTTANAPPYKSGFTSSSTGSGCHTSVPEPADAGRVFPIARGAAGGRVYRKLVANRFITEGECYGTRQSDQLADDGDAHVSTAAAHSRRTPTCPAWRNIRRCGTSRSTIRTSSGWSRPKSLTWFKKPTESLRYTWDAANRKIEHTWFADGQLNVSVNCLDRHLGTPTAKKTALIWQGEADEAVQEIHLRATAQGSLQVRQRAEVQGHPEGRPRRIYMPMIPELPIAMLACTRIGAIHSIVFGGFSADALEGRINDSDVQDADHRQRLAARRQAHPAQGHRRRGAEEDPVDRERHRRQGDRRPVHHAGGPRHLVPRRDGQGQPTSARPRR